MSESHIAHAIATFSELGIATGLVWLTDFIKIRTKLVASMLIARNDFRVKIQADKAYAKGRV